MKFFMMYLGDFAIILLLYTFVVKKVPVLRFLCGMKYQGQAKPAPCEGAQEMSRY